MRSGISFRRATVIQFASRYTGVIIQFILSMVLSRLLTPEEYGVVAIINVFLAFFTMLADLGIAPAVIQFKDLSDDDLNSLFIFSLLLGFILAILFAAFSFILAFLYSNDELIPLGCFASLSVLFGAANMVPNGKLLRDKQFVRIGIRVVTTAVVSGVIAVSMALLGCGCYALVANTVISSLFVLIWNIASTHVRPKGRHFLAPLKHIFSFSAYQFGFSFVNYFSRNFDTILISGVFGSEAVGYYDKAYKLTTYPVSYIPSTLSPVIQPYLSEYQDQPERIYFYYIRLSKILAIIGVFLSLVFFFSANEIITILYGDQWGESVALFRVLSISLMFQLVGNISGSILQSVKHTDYMFRIGLINTALTIIFLVIGIAIGDLDITAFCVSIAFCLHIIAIIYYVVHKALQHRVGDFIKQFVPEIVALAIITPVLLLISPILPSGIWVPFLIKLLIITAIYLIIMLLFGEKKYFDNLFKREKIKKDET